MECSSRARAALRFAAGIMGGLLVQECALCARPGGRRILCEACASRLPRAPIRCPVCAVPGAGGLCGRCLRKPPAYDSTIAVFDYDYPVDHLVQALKYRARLALAPFFADALTAALDEASVQVDCIVPVPLGARRLRERGFNQALEIARRAGRARHLPVHPRALIRGRETQSQASLKIAERERNVRGAFLVARPFSGVRVAVIDDVMTTGATLREVARTLKRAGAASVHNWVIARAAT